MTKGEVAMNNTEHLGTILITGQNLTAWGLPVDVAMTMDAAGRAQMIEALSNGAHSIEVCGTFGEVYTLTFKTDNTNSLGCIVEEEAQDSSD